MAYDLKNVKDVKEYLKNLHIEYQFGCYSEKNPEVCHLLGDFNESIKKNLEKAADLYKANCDERNYAKSCTKYGDFSLIGKGCQKDYGRAYEYMRKGCDLNDKYGCFHAGVVGISDETVEKDKATQISSGIQMLKKACDEDLEKACFYLSGVYLGGIEGYVEKDYKEAYKLSIKCCEQGNPHACGNLYQMHNRGEGAEKNPELAEAFKRRAELIKKEIRTRQRQLQFAQDS